MKGGKNMKQDIKALAQEIINIQSLIGQHNDIMQGMLNMITNLENKVDRLQNDYNRLTLSQSVQNEIRY
jgi:hypothetical protein